MLGGRTSGGEHSSNANGGNIQLIKAVVCAGLYPNVIVAPPGLSPPAQGGVVALKGPKLGAGAQKTAGEVPFQGRKGGMFLHPMTVNFDKKALDSRYGVYHEVVKTSKVRGKRVRWRRRGYNVVRV